VTLQRADLASHACDVDLGRVDPGRVARIADANRFAQNAQGRDAAPAFARPRMRPGA